MPVNLSHRLRHQSLWAIMAEAVCLVAAIGFADYATGYDVSLFVFYAIPIFLVVWYAGRSAGIIICLTCAIAWCIADQLSGHFYTNLAIFTWNAIVQLGFFVFVMICASAVKFQFEKNQAKVEELERFHLLAQISPVGIFRAGPEGKCIYTNERWCDMTGLPEQRSLGESWTQALHPDDRSRVAGEWERVRHGRRAFQFEARFLHPDGSTSWGIGQVAPEAEPLGVGYVGAITDLTAHRRMEREILEVSEREQQRIGQDLHDDLCQFLAAIQYAAASLRGDLEERDSPETSEAGEIVDLLKQAVLRTRNLARGIFPVQLEQGGLVSALQELAAMATRVFGLACSFERDPALHLGPMPSATHVYRIAQEALTNAIKHGLATRVTIRLAARNEWLTLTVEDNGVGLPDGAFEESRGMGLRIMQYRSHMIGGTLHAARGPEAGTVLSCTFRKMPVSTTEPAPASLEHGNPVLTS